jgi:hypothetical protein
MLCLKSDEGGGGEFFFSLKLSFSNNLDALCQHPGDGSMIHDFCRDTMGTFFKGFIGEVTRQRSKIGPQLS